MPRALTGLEIKRSPHKKIGGTLRSAWTAVHRSEADRMPEPDPVGVREIRVDRHVRPLMDRARAFEECVHRGAPDSAAARGREQDEVHPTTSGRVFV